MWRLTAKRMTDSQPTYNPSLEMSGGIRRPGGFRNPVNEHSFGVAGKAAKRGILRRVPIRLERKNHKTELMVFVMVL